jgi:putative aldouronate transport system substrate-binding protein
MDYYTAQNIPNAEVAFVGAIKADENSQPKTAATLGCQGFFVITKAAQTEEDVKKCLDFLDKMDDEEMMILADYGIKDRHYTIESDGRLTRINDASLKQEFQALNQLVPYTEYTVAPSVVLNETKYYDQQIATIADNEKYAVSNPVVGILADSQEYTRNGVALNKILEDARIQYIVGQIDEKQLKEQWDLWAKSGGDKVIEEVNEAAALKAQK